jgi:hypothetical protein
MLGVVDSLAASLGAVGMAVSRQFPWPDTGPVTVALSVVLLLACPVPGILAFVLQKKLKAKKGADQ